MPYLGAGSVVHLSQAESTYGETIGSPTFSPVGVVEDALLEAATSNNRIYGIGSYTPQVSYPGPVENRLRIATVCPSAALMNRAVVRTDNVLASYNCLVGKQSDCWRGVGLKLDGFTFDIPEDGSPCKCAFDAVFKSIASRASTTVVAHSPTPNIWVPSRLAVVIDGVEDTDVISGSITVRNNLQAKRTANDPAGLDNSRLLKYLLEGGMDVEFAYRTYTEVTENLEQDCPAEIDAALEFTSLCGTSVLTFDLTDGHYTNVTHEVRANEYIVWSASIVFDNIDISEV